MSTFFVLKIDIIRNIKTAIGVNETQYLIKPVFSTIF